MLGNPFLFQLCPHRNVNMAQDSDVPTSADKGKGKAEETSKEEKPVLNGKKQDEEKKDGTRSHISVILLRRLADIET